MKTNLQRIVSLYSYLLEYDSKLKRKITYYITKKVKAAHNNTIINNMIRNHKKHSGLQWYYKNVKLIFFMCVFYVCVLVVCIVYCRIFVTFYITFLHIIERSFSSFHGLCFTYVLGGRKYSVLGYVKSKFIKKNTAIR